MIAIFPEIINLVLNQKVERLAYAVRKYHGLPSPQAPILRLEEMLKNIGIQFGYWHREDLAGIVAQDHKGSFQVSMCLPDSRLETVESRYLQAYLLGRFYIDLSPAIASSGELSGGYKINRQCWQELCQGRVPVEHLGADQGWHDAHRFAQSLLLPQAMVRKASRVMQHVDVARFFAVSEQFLQARLLDLDRSEDARPSPVQAPLEETKVPKSGLARLRQLAKKMDPSVDLKS